MTHLLPELSYSLDSLSPYISSETMEYHYKKHHQTYVDNLNKFIIGTEFESMDLEGIIKNSTGPIFNNSAQIWNHTFYFTTFSEDPKSSPSGELLDLIDGKWGSFEMFKLEFNKMALSNFGSGWTWLVKNNSSGELEIMNTSNAQTPITNNEHVPILTCDVWEHAYYIDYRNRRAEYLEKYWNIVDWEIIEKRLI